MNMFVSGGQVSAEPSVRPKYRGRMFDTRLVVRSVSLALVDDFCARASCTGEFSGVLATLFGHEPQVIAHLGPRPCGN